MTRKELKKKHNLSEAMIRLLVIFVNYNLCTPLTIKRVPSYRQTQGALASRGIIRYTTEDGWELTVGGRELQKELRRSK